MGAALFRTINPFCVDFGALYFTVYVKENFPRREGRKRISTSLEFSQSAFLIRLLFLWHNRSSEIRHVWQSWQNHCVRGNFMEKVSSEKHMNNISINSPGANDGEA